MKYRGKALGNRMRLGTFKNKKEHLDLRALGELQRAKDQTLKDGGIRKRRKEVFSSGQNTLFQC